MPRLPRPGSFDRYVEIVRRTYPEDDEGGMAAPTETVIREAWAAIEKAKESERFDGPQVQAVVTHQVRMRDDPGAGNEPHAKDFVRTEDGDEFEVAGVAPYTAARRRYLVLDVVRIDRPAE